MCGITGVIACCDPAHPWFEQIRPATEALQKRGPDIGGYFQHHRCRLGHRRLSVIDVSDAATQPFTDDSGRYTIVFNGEFFNYQEYRKILEGEGYHFRSGSDTEVLLALFIKEGAACLHKINGFFAFAIYDQQEESLFLARDRFGIKPLWVYQDTSVLCFSSELKSLMAYGIPKNIDHTSLFTFLHLNYIPGPHSIFQQVSKLNPGSWMKVSGTEVLREQWYQLKEESMLVQHIKYAEAHKELLHKLDQAVQLRMVSDVPLGAFLSGGIDSSAVVALATRYTSQLKTFSIGYRDEPLFDETIYAEMVSEKFKTNHTVFSLTNDDLFNHLFEALDYLDEPYADSSALAVYILSKETRKHVTVALSGDAADEMFGGYQKHRGEWQIRNGGYKGALVSLLEPLWNIMPQSRNTHWGNLFRKLSKFAEGSNMNATDRYWRWCGYADASYLEDLPAFQINHTEFSRRKSAYTRFIRGGSDLNDVLMNDMHLVLPGDMLPKVDMMSMANSLEVRSPFFDRRVVEFAFSLPSSMKVNGKEGKLVLKDAFRELLPAELFNRPKHGFEVPLLKWFRKELDTYIFNELLHPDYIKEQGLFHPEAIRQLRQQLHSSNPGDSTARIWALMVFQYWWKKWIN